MNKDDPQTFSGSEEGGGSPEENSNPTPGDSEEPEASGPVEPEILENLPPEIKRVMQIGFGMQRVGPIPSPLASKVNEQHISRILEITEEDSKRDFTDVQRARWFSFGYVLLFCALFVFLTIYLAGENSALYGEIVKLAVAFLGGVGSGFGVKTYLDRKAER